jgi:hypothetical protein
MSVKILRLADKILHDLGLDRLQLWTLNPAVKSYPMIYKSLLT